MQPNNMKLRVSVHLKILLGVIVVAFVLVACTSNTPNQNGTQRQTVTAPSPSPSPSPTGSPRIEILPGDTIIVIKDGSVNIKVNKTLCDDDDSDTAHPDKKFKCDHELGSVRIETASGPIPVPITTDSLVTINGGGGGAEGIEIKGSSRKVSIKFKKATYPKCSGGPDGEHCGTNQVKTIKVDTPAFSKTCVPADKCEVWVNKK